MYKTKLCTRFAGQIDNLVLELKQKQAFQVVKNWPLNPIALFFPGVK